jgi:hypothetical protein
MKAIRRREFLGTALAGGAALLAGSKSAAFEFKPGFSAQSTDSRVEDCSTNQSG